MANEEKKIKIDPDNLTPHQKECLAKVREELIARGYDTTPVDKDKASKAYHDAYAFRKAPLDGIHWVQSPIEGAEVVAAILLRGAENHPEIRPTEEEISKVSDTHRHRIIRASRGGNLELAWPGLFRFFRMVGEEFDPEDDQALNIWWDLGAGHLWWPLDGWVVACENPDTIHLDRNGNLSCRTGPALRYRDGFGLYYIEGHPVQPHVCNAPHTIKLEEIRDTQNVTVRRILMEQYGIPRFLKDINAKVLDRRRNEALVQDDVNNLRWLLCADGSTNKLHPVVVPNNVRTCSEAQLQLSGVPEEQHLERS